MNYYKNFNFIEAEKIIKLAISEDIGKGDITTELLIPEDSISCAELLIKESGTIAGLKLFERVFRILDDKIKIKFFCKDGSSVKKGDKVLWMKGNTSVLLKGERTALNILQRMSGAATVVSRLKTNLGNNDISIIDTRKTTPNFRIFEKLAVKMGGGENHRYGLYDMILIKDNHIEANGGIEKTLKILKLKKKKIKAKVEIEVKNLEELIQVLENGKGIVNRIMLDNFSIKDVEKAIILNQRKFEIEISGGINESNISKYKGVKGIDYISVGSITHSAKAMDISMNFITCLS